MSSSLQLACFLTPSPRTKSLLSTSTPKLTTKTTFFPLPCKLQTSHIPSNKSFHHYAVSPSTTDVLTSSENVQTTLTDDQWAKEREILLQQIRNLVVKIQQLSSTSEVANNGSKTALKDILKELYSLDTKIFGLDPNKSMPRTFFETTLMDLAGKLQDSETSDDGMVPIDPNPLPGQTSNEIDQLVHAVSSVHFQDAATPYYLTGNFAPLRQETPPTNTLVVSGEIPKSINGMMLRNGPDPKFDPEGSYGWMDGDSMVHGIQFKDGTATYVSRYVGTSRYVQEGDFDRAEMFKYGDLYGEYGLFAMYIQSLRSRLQILDMSYGYTNANTGLVYHSGTFMALEDFGKPHAFSVSESGDIQTIGINDYNGLLDHWVTPHPKKDPVTGEMFVFGSKYTKPYCTYNVISKEGVMGAPVPITIQDPIYMHDLGLTENYVIFMDLPYVFSPEYMVKNEKNWVYSLDPTKKSRFGILPRYATSEEEIKWFEFEDPFFIFHNANAWEDENGNIVMYSGVMDPAIDPKTGEQYLAPAISRIESILERELTFPRMNKLTFNMTTMEATREIVTDTKVDNLKINESYIGRPTQYLYASEVNRDSKMPSVRKYNLNSNGGPIDTPLIYDEGIYGNEVVFVSKPNPISEDDGYLIAFAQNENTNTTSNSLVYIIDAQTMTITTTIELPNRVPYGFHAIFVTEEELQAQITTST